MENRQALQQKYMELQMLDQQIKQVQKQLQMINEQLTEIDLISQGLDDLSKTKQGSEILVPVGIFLKADIKDAEDLIVNVGAGVAVKKNISQTKEMLAVQRDEIKKLQIHLSSDLNNLIMHATAHESEIGGLMGENNK